MTTLTFPQFLVHAKLHTYAGAGERAERKLPDGGKEFVKYCECPTNGQRPIGKKYSNTENVHSTGNNYWREK